MILSPPMSNRTVPLFPYTSRYRSPRPHARGSTAGNELFWHASQQYWLRHALKPGITGRAQIRGYRGATECVEDLARRVRCDLEYLSNWSLWTDVMIMIKTIRVVIHKNAY